MNTQLANHYVMRNRWNARREVLRYAETGDVQPVQQEQEDTTAEELEILVRLLKKYGATPDLQRLFDIAKRREPEIKQVPWNTRGPDLDERAAGIHAAGQRSTLTTGAADEYSPPKNVQRVAAGSASPGRGGVGQVPAGSVSGNTYSGERGIQYSRNRTPRQPTREEFNRAIALCTERNKTLQHGERANFGEALEEIMR